MNKAVAGVAFAVFLGGTALADPLERYAELQAVGEAINDPDPLMRLALMEELIARGDATEVQLAIRTAFTIDDPNIRSLALRTHFASFRTVVIAADYPAELQQAIKDGKDALKAAQRAYQDQFEFMDFLGGRFTFRTEYDGSAPEFAVMSMNAMSEPNPKYSGFGNIKGSVVTLQSGTRLRDNLAAFNCTFEFTDYVGFTIKGVGSCDMGKTLPFPVTLHLFEPDASGS